MNEGSLTPSDRLNAVVPLSPINGRPLAVAGVGQAGGEIVISPGRNARHLVPDCRSGSRGLRRIRWLRRLPQEAKHSPGLVRYRPASSCNNSLGDGAALAQRTAVHE